jgi:hypothetical protein
MINKRASGSAVLLICIVMALITIAATALWWTCAFYAEAIYARSIREQRTRMVEGLLLYGVAYYKASSVQTSVYRKKEFEEVVVYEGPWHQAYARLTLLPGEYGARITAIMRYDGARSSIQEERYTFVCFAYIESGRVYIHSWGKV